MAPGYEEKLNGSLPSLSFAVPLSLQIRDLIHTGALRDFFRFQIPVRSAQRMGMGGSNHSSTLGLPRLASSFVRVKLSGEKVRHEGGAITCAQALLCSSKSPEKSSV
jgi:hypothetical protein